MQSCELLDIVAFFLSLLVFHCSELLSCFETQLDSGVHLGLQLMAKPYDWDDCLFAQQRPLLVNRVPTA